MRVLQYIWFLLFQFVPWTELSPMRSFVAAITSYKHKLCIVEKVKIMSTSLSCNLIEWIEYHVLLGVNHFYITDDCSLESNVLHALLFYEKLGLVTLITSFHHDRNECKQYIPNEGKVYKRMFDKARNDCEWVANIDFDEYITFWEYNERYLNLSTYLDLYPLPFVRMPWWVYSHYDYTHRPNGLVIESYFSASLQNPRYIKTIVRTNEVDHFHNPHFPKLLRLNEKLPVNITIPGAPLSTVSREAKFKSENGAHSSSATSSSSSTEHTATALTIHKPMTRVQYIAINSVHPFEKKLSHVQLTTDRKSTPHFSEISRKSGVRSTRRKRQQQRQHQRSLSNTHGQDNNHPVLLPLSVEVPIPATEIFLKHYKYLSWNEFQAQRAATPTLPNGRTNYWAQNPRQHWEKGNRSTLSITNNHDQLVMIVKDNMCCKIKIETNILKYTPLDASSSVYTSSKTPTSPLHGMTTGSNIQSSSVSRELLELIGLGDVANIMVNVNYDIGRTTKDDADMKTMYDKSSRNHRNSIVDTVDVRTSTDPNTPTNKGVNRTVHVDIDIASEFTRRMGERVRVAIRERWEQVKRTGKGPLRNVFEQDCQPHWKFFSSNGDGSVK